MRTRAAAALLILAAGTMTVQTETDDARAAEAPPAPVSSEPQQTAATFGDWTVRCDRVGSDAAAKPVCEAAESLLVKGQQAPIAQVAFGHLPTDPANLLTLTVLLPINISFQKPPKLGADTDEAKTVPLTYRRCIPGGCLADTKLAATALTDLRNAKGPGRLYFTDAGERTLALPLSFRGLPQALDNLAKSTTGSPAR